MSSYIIEVESLSRRYANGTLALDQATLRVEEGSVYGLLGRNGSGKSTLIKMVMALLHPSSGEVRVFGKDPWSDHAGIKARIGYISEDQTLPPYLKIRDMFQFMSECYANWDVKNAEKLRKAFDLDPKKKIMHLSRGQQRQVGLICAVAHSPELLILDEPAGGLDAIARRDLLEMIIELLNKQGTTVFFSSHHLHDVERIADHVGILDRGKVLLESSLDDLRENYCRVVVPLVPGAQDKLSLHSSCVSIRQEADVSILIFSVNLTVARDIVSEHLPEGSQFQGAAMNLEDVFIALVGEWE